MAAVTTAVVVGAGQAYAANRQGAAAKKAGNARANAAQQAIDNYGQIYDQSRQDAMPWLNAGTSALAQMQALNSGDFSSFHESPDYQFALTQGLQGLDRSAAARGGLYSGGADADRMAYASGLASQNYNSFYNRLADLSRGGQAQSQYLGSLGQNYGNQVGQALGAKGEGKAQAASATAAAQAGYGNAIGSAFGAYMGMGGGAGAQQAGGSNLWGGLGQTSQWGQAMAAGQGSVLNFGNNLANFNSRKSGYGG